MSLEIVFQGLNMKALNSLIWASAVLAKMGVLVLALSILIYIGALIYLNLDWLR